MTFLISPNYNAILHKLPYYCGVSLKLFPFPQEQYMFVYDAVRELLLLGDTTIKASDLKSVISQLKSKSDGKSSYYQQFDVSDSLYATDVYIFYN